MPLRDHFRPPLAERKPWEALQGGWPMKIVEQLNAMLPPEYEADPRVHLGSAFEIDVSTYERDSPDSPQTAADNGHGDAATQSWSPGEPSLLLDSEIPTPSEYEVLVYDVSLERRLVAAVEIVSPGNKDRAEARRSFIYKCEALLYKEVCVAIVDLVTIRSANLYRDLAELMGAPERVAVQTPIYAVVLRGLRHGTRWRAEKWEHELVIGQPLPTLPLWLNETQHVPLDLESSYEATCRALRIG